MLLEFLHKVKASAKVTPVQNRFVQLSVVHIPHEDSTGHIIFTARKRSLGQGNIFTPVCHSVHRGGGAWSGGVPCPRGCLLLGVCLLPGAACSRRGVPGGDPPRTATAAGGTHSTGMHSCWIGMRPL